MSNEKKKLLNHTGFLFLDHPIPVGFNNIDRIGQDSLYYKNEVIPIKWKYVKSRDLLTIFKEIKANRVYVKKEYDGRYYNTRLKPIKIDITPSEK